MLETSAARSPKIPRHNQANDRLKRTYLSEMAHDDGHSVQTVDQARHAIDLLERYTGFKDFKTYTREQGLGFKERTLESRSQRTGQQISLARVRSILREVQKFLSWLNVNRHMPRSFKIASVKCLQLKTGDERRATTKPPRRFAPFANYKSAVLAMPSTTEVERRDQAIMAMLLTSSMRISALIDLKIRDVDFEKNYIFQDPRHMRTKFSKGIDTFLLPVGDDVRAIIQGWVRYLIKDRQFGPDDPIFPKTAVPVGEDGEFKAAGVSRDHWTTGTTVRKIFRDAFARIGLRYTDPHTTRHTLTQYAYSLDLTLEEAKAWSQNLGHDDLLTTLNSYGQIARERQGELIAKLGNRKVAEGIDEMTPAKLSALLTEKLKANVN
jgi:integrase/recombinase XerD